MQVSLPQSLDMDVDTEHKKIFTDAPVIAPE